MSQSAANNTVDMKSIQSIQPLFESQKRFFESGATRSAEFRRQQMDKLKRLFKDNEGRLTAALQKDLGKPEFEAYGSEIGFMLEEVGYTLSHFKNWMKPTYVQTPIVHQPSTSMITPEPLGVTLIIGAWNYPLQLIAAPLVAAIAAGNTAILKPSELSMASSKVVAELIPKYFDPNYIAVVEGGVAETSELLKQPWDHIFFTGSTAVGKIVARAAAENLSSCTLELGGKSPCIVDSETDIVKTARRIVWGKFFNAGQTCVAPDYLLVPSSIKSELLAEMKKTITQFYGSNPRQSVDYARIVNERHFDRLQKMLGEGTTICGGEAVREERYIAPTIVDGASLDHKMMQEEIFGPILPVFTYQGLDNALAFTRKFPNPLAAYFFSTNKQRQDEFIEKLPFGGGCINNTLVHLSNPNLPFGGRGGSGYGNYHGKFGFDTFSHQKAIMKSSFLIDLDIKYPEYGSKLALLKAVVR